MEPLTTRPEDRLAENHHRLVVITTLFGVWVFAVTLLVALILTGWVSLLIAPVIAFVVAGAWVSISSKSAKATVLDLTEAEPADDREHARLFNVASALSASSGVSPPEMYIVEDPAVNAFAVGRDARSAAVAVTTGMLESLDVVELEAVLAVVFYRIKTEQIAAETFAVPTVGVALVLADHFESVPVLQRLFSLPSSFVEGLLTRLHPAQSDFDADMGAVAMTRYPPALASALHKMHGRSALAFASPVTAHLWVAPPLNAVAQPGVVAMHKPLDQRVAVLQEL